MYLNEFLKLIKHLLGKDSDLSMYSSAKIMWVG